MNSCIVGIIGGLVCICMFVAGYVVGIAYTVETLKTEGEKDE